MKDLALRSFVSIAGLLFASLAAGAAELPPLVVPEGLGVNIHFTDPKPGEMEMLAQSGMKWVRMDFAWGGTEREKGKYDFTAYDRLMSALDKHKIRALLILDYSNPHYDKGLSPASDEGRQAFARWAAAAARHFRGRGILWEMYNEPNIFFWRPKPDVDQYVKLALAVGKALREAEPAEMYIGPATSQIDMKFLEACFKAGLLEYWCAVSVHPYRQTAPETAAAEYARLRAMIDQYAPKGKKIPILSGEWGYSSAWKDFDDVKQGKYLPRQWLVDLANGVPLSIWYDWHDDGQDPKEPEHHFGTVRFPHVKDRDPVYDPKPSYLAAKTLTAQLGGFQFKKRLAAGGEDDYVLLFAKGDELRLAAWTTAATSRAVSIPVEGKFKVTAHTGESLPPIASGDKGLSITLTDAPQYLVPEGKAAPAAASPPGDALTYLYDAPEASAARIAEQGLSKAGQWSRLDEDDTTHRFQGCAVLTNDKIVAVLRKDTPEVDFYVRQPQGAKLCARLQPICDGSTDLKRTSIAIKENSRSSVALEVGFRSPRGEPRHIVYELNAGAPFIKTTAGAGLEKLRVQAPCRFAVLPDFFGDDMLIDAAAIPAARAELPSENFLLHMLPGGEAILMTVSESRENDIAVALRDASPREIVSSDISYGKKPRIWIAVLAGKGIWHEHAVTLADAGKVLDLDWQMPYAALWRVDWSTADKLTDTWEMLLQEPGGKYVMQGWFGQDESEGQRFGKEFGDRDWNKPGRKRWNPVLGAFTFPCWIDNDGRGHLEPLKELRYAERGKASHFAGPAVIYPIDRVKTAPFQTPLESLTVVDLVRLTLGVGPCQYILDLEGQKRNSRGVATCYARDVINAIYKAGTQLQNRSVIEEQLAACVAFIANVRERIDLYVKFGHDMSAYLEKQKGIHPRQAEFFDELLALTSRLDGYFEENREKIRTPAYAQKIADGFRQNLLTYAEKDAYQKCAREMGIFTSIGGAQDGLVASCRMIVKTLRQRAGIVMAVDPELKDVATEIRNRTQAILRNPTPYEAPRH